MLHGSPMIGSPSARLAATASLLGQQVTGPGYVLGHVPVEHKKKAPLPPVYWRWVEEGGVCTA
jgi:hypothetical protein